ncbi:ribonuclease H-like protein [Hymenopellis radicata]|nr:ribonuclease H-like protein [Hymenopellis radicata]
MHNLLRNDPAWACFQPYVSLTSVSDGFRVLTNVSTFATRGLPSIRAPDPDQFPSQVVVYTDGSCARNGSQDASAGSGIWHSPSDIRNIALRVPEALAQTSPVAELYAVQYNLALSPSRSLLCNFTDSRLAINALTVYFPQWEDRAWLGVKNRELMQSLVATLRKRRGLTAFHWVKGHSNNLGNDGADALANQGALLPVVPSSTLKLLPGGLLLPGAKLSCLSIRVACQLLAEHSPLTITKTCMRNLRTVQSAIEDRSGTKPSWSLIWKAIEHKDLSRNVRQWMWYALHGAFKLGRRWLHIPGCADRAFCQHCGREDTMSHILFECSIPGQAEIWHLARYVVEGKKVDWWEPTLGLILGAPLIRIKSSSCKPLPGSSRLLRIVLSESAHLIWSLRCERVVVHQNSPGKWWSPAHIENLWRQRINERIKIDCLMTSRSRFGRSTLSVRMVTNTWSGTLRDEGALPAQWVWQPEFLVGIRTPPHGRPAGGPR